MRALLALFRSVDRFARFSRRHPARRGGAARTQSARSAGRDARARSAGSSRSRSLSLDQALKAAVLMRFGEAAQALDAARPVSRSRPCAGTAASPSACSRKDRRLAGSSCSG